MKTRSWAFASLFLATLATASAASSQTKAPGPTELEGLRYERELFPGASYDASVPTPESILGFPVGEQTASLAQMQECLEAWSAASPRARLVEYARSHEGRPLHYVILTTEENMARLDSIREGQRRLADPRGLGEEEASRLLGSQPAVAWLAYSIHGNETSGSDAALALVYHLAASRDAAVRDLLQEVVVLIDPTMNPDGRHRFLSQKDEARGASPNVDDQSLIHTGYRPSGRTNHYFFDLNRDWILGVQPETRGRIAAAGEWHPLLFVDAHEMGSQDTFLFSPPREPVNHNFPEGMDQWMARFAREQAAAFDRMGWIYYTGEWNEGWYPGYSNSWAGFRGAVGFLYEQARTAEDAVRLPGGGLRTYLESVHHQVVASMANLESLRTHAAELKTKYLEWRRAAVDAGGPYGDRTFAILPTKNRTRLGKFLELMELQGIEVYTLTERMVAPAATDQLGREIRRRDLPEGTLLIPNRQPEANLLAAMLEFDPRMPGPAVARERKELLKTGESRVYDVTAWNLTMLYGLEALTLPTGLPQGAARLESPARSGPVAAEAGEEVVAWVVNGIDDGSVAAAARLMERGVHVRVAKRTFLFDKELFPIGSVVIVRSENSSFDGDLPATLKRTAGELGLEAVAVRTGLGEGELPDLGGRHFPLLEPPRIALLTRGGVSAYDFGAVWHTLDQRIGIRHSHVVEEFVTYADLRRYNVLVLPHRFSRPLPDRALQAIRTWVEAGGTLIAIGGSAEAVARGETGIGSVRLLPDVLGEIDLYELAVRREWMALNGEMPGQEAVWSHSAPAGVGVPWENGSGGKRPSKEELEKRDRWHRIFMPQGALLAGRVDRESWLTFGAGDYVPVLFGDHPVLMSLNGVEVAIRLGVLSPASSGSDPAGEEAGAGQVGWAGVPEGYELRLRMSGLLWPEAAQRLANAAYLTREGVGRGQVILFASPPVFRGATLGTARFLMNTMIYGPGLGASHPIEP